MIPLQADLAAQQKRLRMHADATDRRLELDLRNETDLQRSRLLHRLRLLDIDWGHPEHVIGKKGTFHEHWRIQWKPEMTIAVIESSVYGNTVLDAATAYACERAQSANALSQVAALVETVLVADLPDAIGPVIERLEEVAAAHSDVAELADALPPLTASLRYGTVRRTEAARVAPVLDAIFTRLCVGLPAACASLDEESSRAMCGRLDGVQSVVILLDDADKRSRWTGALKAIASTRGGSWLVSGKSERLRFDLNDVSGEHLALRLGQAVSVGVDAKDAAAFVEGMLDGPGAILLHQDDLFKAVDEWLVSIDTSAFDEILPLVRRSFALFTRPERRLIGERVAGGGKSSARLDEIDEERAARVLPIVRLILGMTDE
jgi:hypothetical protein